MSIAFFHQNATDIGIYFYRAERNLDGGRIKIRSFVLVKIDEALPVVSPAYDQGQSEEQVREKMQRYVDSLLFPLSGKD